MQYSTYLLTLQVNLSSTASSKGVDMYWLAAGLAIILRAMQSVLVILKNGYLPILVRNHPLFPSHEKKDGSKSVDGEILFNQVSTRSAMMGYLAGILMSLLAGTAMYLSPDWPYLYKPFFCFLAIFVGNKS